VSGNGCLFFQTIFLLLARPNGNSDERQLYIKAIKQCYYVASVIEFYLDVTSPLNCFLNKVPGLEGIYVENPDIFYSSFCVRFLSTTKGSNSLRKFMEPQIWEGMINGSPDSFIYSLGSCQYARVIN
jgi:hypothetical protein